MDERIRKAYLIPGDQQLPRRKSPGGVAVVIPAFQAHLAVALKYQNAAPAKP